MLEYNIRTLFFQNGNEGFLQHVWVRSTSYYAFGKKGGPVTRFVGMRHKRHSTWIVPCTCKQGMLIVACPNSQMMCLGSGKRAYH
jgi:hypothetical protein